MPLPSQRAGISIGSLLALAAVAASAAIQTTSDTAPASADASADLTALLGTMQIHRLQTHFFCRKTVLNLETPLLSGGEIWVGAAGGGGPVGLRLKTEWPYVSEIILANGFTKARSQHETGWSTSLQSFRPGLTAIMVHIGDWSTGARGRADLFNVARGGEIPARPHPPAATSAASPNSPATQAAAGGCFLLTPANKDLATSVKQVTLGFAATAGAAPSPVVLTYVQIVTAQGDITEYWFYDQTIDPELPADIFEPKR